MEELHGIDALAAMSDKLFERASERAARFVADIESGESVIADVVADLTASVQIERLSQEASFLFPFDPPMSQPFEPEITD